MTDLNLKDLRCANRYLIDLGSTLDLFGPRTDGFLRGGGKWNQVLQVWCEGRGRDAVWEAIADLADHDVQQALETMVTADMIGFDEALQSGSKDRLGFDLTTSWAVQNHILASVSVPHEVREQAWSEIVKHRGDLTRSFGSERGLFHAGDKRCHDHGFEQRKRSEWFADSEDHPARALYYLRLSEVAQVPCYLSKKKRSYVDDLVRLGRRARGVDDPHREVKGAVLSCLAEQHGLLPPVAEVVIMQALEKQCSPGEALVEVRRSKEAGAYREKLRELRHGARVRTVAGRADVEAYLDELRVLGAIWKHDPYERIRYNTTKVEKAVSVIPMVGSLLSLILPRRVEQFLGTELGLADPVHVFVSRWFRRDTKSIG